MTTQDNQELLPLKMKINDKLLHTIKNMGCNCIHENLNGCCEVCSTTSYYFKNEDIPHSKMFTVVDGASMMGIAASAAACQNYNPPKDMSDSLHIKIENNQLTYVVIKSCNDWVNLPDRVKHHIKDRFQCRYGNICVLDSEGIHHSSYNKLTAENPKHKCLMHATKSWGVAGKGADMLGDLPSQRLAGELLTILSFTFYGCGDCCWDLRSQCCHLMHLHLDIASLVMEFDNIGSWHASEDHPMFNLYKLITEYGPKYDGFFVAPGIGTKNGDGVKIISMCNLYLTNCIELSALFHMSPFEQVSAQANGSDRFTDTNKVRSGLIGMARCLAINNFFNYNHSLGIWKTPELAVTNDGAQDLRWPNKEKTDMYKHYLGGNHYGTRNLIPSKMERWTTFVENAFILSAAKRQVFSHCIHIDKGLPGLRNDDSEESNNAWIQNRCVADGLNPVHLYYMITNSPLLHTPCISAQEIDTLKQIVIMMAGVYESGINIEFVMVRFLMRKSQAAEIIDSLASTHYKNKQINVFKPTFGGKYFSTSIWKTIYVG